MNGCPRDAKHEFDIYDTDVSEKWVHLRCYCFDCEDGIQWTASFRYESTHVDEA